MSDEQSEPSENGAKPGSGAAPLSSRARTAPVIQGEATEVPDSAASAPPPAQALEAGESQPESPNAPPAETPRKNFALRLLAASAGACILGVAGYFGWTEWASRAAPLEPVAVAAIAPPHVEPAPVIAPAVVASPVEAPAVASPPAVDVPKTENPAADLPKTVEAPHEPEPTPSVKSEAVEANPVDANPVATNPVEANPVEAKPETLKTVVVEPGTENALAEVTARLAATQAALDQVTARLQALEGQFAAPKIESRAPLAERQSGPANAAPANVGPANTGDISARIVAAQSLLTAIRQGDDYAPLLTALQNLGGDPNRLARLRDGLSAPNAEALAKDFSALKTKILAGAAPPAAQPRSEKAPQNVGETVLTFLQNRTEKLVRIRPAGAPDGDETAIRVGRIEKNLARGDIAAALAERAQLPPPALAISANWASGAQAHLDAELAAKAELAAAMQDLSKSRS